MTVPGIPLAAPVANFSHGVDTGTNMVHNTGGLTAQRTATWPDRSGTVAFTDVFPAAKNYLLNPDFAVTQLQPRTTLTGYATGTYCGADQWRVQHDAGGSAVQFRNWRIGDASPPVSFQTLGHGSYGEFKNTTGGPIGLAVTQMTPADQALDLVRAGSIGIGFMLALSSATLTTWKAALFEWTGTANSTTARDPVASWSSHVPTFNATTNANVGSVNASSASANTWLPGKLTANPVSLTTATNYILVIWVEGLPAGASVYLSNADIANCNVFGSNGGVRQFSTLGYAAELARCQEFLQTFGANSNLSMLQGNGNTLYANVVLPVAMRINPTVSASPGVTWSNTFGTVTTTQFSAVDPRTGASVTITGALTLSAVVNGPQVLQVQLIAGTSFSSTVGDMIVVANGTAAYWIFDARI